MFEVLEAKKSVQGTALEFNVCPIDSFDEAERILPEELATHCRRLKDVCQLPKTTDHKPKKISLERIFDLRGGNNYGQHLNVRDKIPCAYAASYLLGLLSTFCTEGGIPAELYDYALIIAPQPVCRRDDSSYFMTAEIVRGKIRLSKVRGMWLQGDAWVLAQGVLESPYV